jgi:hypothetical protein
MSRAVMSPAQADVAQAAADAGIFAGVMRPTPWDPHAWRGAER